MQLKKVTNKINHIVRACRVVRAGKVLEQGKGGNRPYSYSVIKDKIVRARFYLHFE